MKRRYGIKVEGLLQNDFEKFKEYLTIIDVSFISDPRLNKVVAIATLDQIRAILEDHSGSGMEFKVLV